MNNLDKSTENLNAIIDNNKKMQEIREEVVKKFKDYTKTLNFMMSDAPISVLCLPKTIEKSLTNHGCLRIYDLFNCDFTKIKGLGIVRIRDLTARLDEFFSML